MTIKRLHAKSSWFHLTLKNSNNIQIHTNEMPIYSKILEIQATSKYASSLHLMAQIYKHRLIYQHVGTSIVLSTQEI